MDFYIIKKCILTCFLIWALYDFECGHSYDVECRHLYDYECVDSYDYECRSCMITNVQTRFRMCGKDFRTFFPHIMIFRISGPPRTFQKSRFSWLHVFQVFLVIPYVLSVPFFFSRNIVLFSQIPGTPEFLKCPGLSDFHVF